MSAPLTIRIIVGGTAALDGSTLFVSSQSSYDSTTGITTHLAVGPAGVFDLADLLGIYSRSFVINAISVENDEAIHSAGSVIEQISPPRVSGSEGNRRLMQSLGNTSGVFTQANHILPIDHRLAINTVADAATPGPHTIQISLSPFSGTFLNSQLSNQGGNAVSVLTWKSTARLASTANQNIAALVPGVSVDGVATAEGDRVLLKNQTAPAENGIYTIQGTGEPAVRSEDASNNAEVGPGMACAVTEGTANSGNAYVLATPAPIQLGTTALTFGEIGADGGAETYAQTLALGQDSGALGPYLNTPQRSVVGSDLASSPTPGVFAGSAEAYHYEGSHVASLVAGGGEAAGTYVLDPVDILRNTNVALFDGGTAVIEWEAYRYASSDGIDPVKLRGYGAGKATWTVGNGSTAENASLYSDVEQFSTFDVARLAVGSTARSIAFEILEAPDVGPVMPVKLYYRITYANNVTSF